MPFSLRGTTSHCIIVASGEMTIEMLTCTAYRIYIYNNNSITT